MHDEVNTYKAEGKYLGCYSQSHQIWLQQYCQHHILPMASYELFLTL